MEDAAHLTVEFMRRSIGVASGDFGLWLVRSANRRATQNTGQVSTSKLETVSIGNFGQSKDVVSNWL